MTDEEKKRELDGLNSYFEYELVSTRETIQHIKRLRKEMENLSKLKRYLNTLERKDVIRYSDTFGDVLAAETQTEVMAMYLQKTENRLWGVMDRLRQLEKEWKEG